jgi:TRAP-type mannitol/chloroaromatic compound transport system permease small subunit
MKILEKTVAIIGKAVSWLTLAMVLLTVAIVIMRYGFNLGWIWLQESVTYMHAMVFMLAAGWTLQLDGHVRVDIFYRSRSAKHKAWVNIAGTLLFLLPICIFLLVIGWEYVWSSWKLQEQSREAGGLPAVYLLKTLILLMPGLLVLQAIPWLLQCVRTVRSNTEESAASS